MSKDRYGFEKPDIMIKAGFTRVLNEEKDIIHYEKDGKKFRRMGHRLIEI